MLRICRILSLLLWAFPMVAMATNSFPKEATGDVFSSSFVFSPTGWQTPAASPRLSIGTRGLPAVELPITERLTLHIQTLLTYYWRVGAILDIAHTNRSGLALRVGVGSSPYAFSLMEADAGIHAWHLFRYGNGQSTLLGAGLGLATGGDWEYSISMPFVQAQSGTSFNIGLLHRLNPHYALVSEFLGGVSFQKDELFMLTLGGRYSTRYFGIQFGIWRPFIPDNPHAFDKVAVLPYISIGWQSIATK